MPIDLNIELYNKSKQLGLSKNTLILNILWEEVENSKVKKEVNG